jgi:hypothetical protein
LVYVVNNHHHFAHNPLTSLLEPTEFTIGLSAGLTIGTLVVAVLMAQTFQTGGVLCDSETQHAMSTATGSSGGKGGASSSAADTPNGTAAINSPALIDPLLYNACANHRLNMSSISFWSGLCAWLSAVIAILLTVGKNDILMARHYERIADGSNSNTIDSFEEIYRRQQREILGAQQAAALQNRATALFVGDYSSVPEVTQGNGTAATSR